MQKTDSTPNLGAARHRIMRRLDSLIEERTAFGHAFEAYLKGTLTSTDCSTLVDVALRQLAEDAHVSEKHAVLLEMVTDAVAQLANRDAAR